MTPLNLKMTPSFADNQTFRRWRYTKNFIEKVIKLDVEKKDVLDIGQPNGFAKHMSEYFQMNCYFTTSDLDYELTIDTQGKALGELVPFNYVFCFEVLEHLMNPLLLLENIKKVISERSQVFISVPRTPRWLWNDTHFNEFTEKRIQHLFKSAGYRVTAHEWHISWHDPWFYFTGIRPFIRLTIGANRNHLYLLEKI